MNLVFFTHPSFLGSQSMPRFAQMLTEGMKKRGHRVEILTAEPKFFNLPVPANLKKWAGYIDQYIVFPSQVRKRLNSYPENTLFVFTDHALGPWVPLVSRRPHVIHCHDFLAQLSALKAIKENQTAFTGRIYQQFIRRGYSSGENFLSVSKKTKTDLDRFLTKEPKLCKVIYNGLNQSFEKLDTVESRILLSEATGLDLSMGYILHIGGNQWYKNRPGVIEIYDSWRSGGNELIPLLMIGKPPTTELDLKRNSSRYAQDIFFLTDITDEQLQLAYSGAILLLFPSLAEGFGWPIAEAMASGCPVVTTDEPPMTEVAGGAAFLIPRKPELSNDIAAWAKKGGEVIEVIVNLPAEKRQAVIADGIANAKRFETDAILDQIENAYQIILESYNIYD